MKTKHLILMTFLFLFSVVTGYGQDMKKLVQNRLLEVYFTPNEKREIIKIIEFTDNIVKSEYPSENINESYHLYMDSIWNQALNHNNIDALSIEQNKKLSFIKTLNSEFFNEIWRYDVIKDSVRIKGKYIILDKPITKIDIRPNFSKVSYYYNAVGMVDQRFKEIFEVMSIAGSLAIVYQGTYMNLDKFDFSKIEDRLWAAIILLTVDQDIEVMIKNRNE